MKPTSERCPATSKRTGERCGQFVPGGGVCRWHGGAARQVKAKREARIALQEQLASEDRRAPWEVLLDALHTADVLAKKAKDDITVLTPETLEALVTATNRAATLAKMGLDAGIDERRVNIAERQGELLAAGVTWLLAAIGRDDDKSRRAAGLMFQALHEGRIPGQLVAGEVTS